MGQRKKAAISKVSDARIARLRQAIKSVATDLGQARKDRSWSAVAALHRQSQSLGAELDAALIERSRDTVEPMVERTPEQVMADETRHAGELEPIHMHVYVREFLRQNRGVHLATDDGPLELCG